MREVLAFGFRVLTADGFFVRLLRFFFGVVFANAILPRALKLFMSLSGKPQ